MNDEPCPRLLVWFDTEFTSLDYDRGQLLQTAMVITDLNLQRVLAPEDDLNLVVSLPDGAELSDWVQENLAELIGQSRGEEALAVEAVDRRLADTVIRASGGAVPESIKLRPVLAGNSIHSDLTMARRWLPTLVDTLHYRLLDVSSVKMLWQAWRQGEVFDKDRAELVQQYLPFEAPLAGRPHDAYYDTLASIAELAYYRQQPGWLEGRS